MTSYDIIFRFQKVYSIYDAESEEEAIEKAKKKFTERCDDSENIPEAEFDIIVKKFR